VDLSGPFRGSVARASGAVTRSSLAGPRFRRLFPDVYVPSSLPLDLALLSRAAALLVSPGGVLSGYSAAELLGASCGPMGAPAEVTLPNYRKPVPRLVVHRDRLAAEEIVTVHGCAVTSPARTAFDLARWHGLTEGVVAADALAHRHAVLPDDLRVIRSRHLGLPGSRRIEPVLALVDPRADSPRESRIRVALTLGGLRPAVQHPVTVDGRLFLLDMAYPSALLGVEYDGGHHREAEQARRDLERESLLAMAGWKVIRFGAGVVLNRPDLVVARTRAELARRAGVIAVPATSSRPRPA
jgi:very-short-patch-repair endonuclease